MHDPVSVREGECAEDLTRVVDRDRHRRRAVLDEQLLERAPVEVLHRDVVGAFGVAAVEDRNDARVVETRRALRLPPEPLDELLVGGVPVVQELQRDAAAELLVLGEVHIRHPARSELPLDHITGIERASDQCVAQAHGFPATGFDAPGRIACTSCLAMGAATAPPNPPAECSMTTAPATTGWS